MRKTKMSRKKNIIHNKARDILIKKLGLIDTKIFLFFLEKSDSKYENSIKAILYLIENIIQNSNKNRVELEKELDKLLDITIPLMRKDTSPTPAMFVCLNLLEINEILVAYTKYDNRILKALSDDKLVEKNFKFRDTMVDLIGKVVKIDFWEKLGYDVAYNEYVENKIKELLQWIPKAATRFIKYNNEYMNTEMRDMFYLAREKDLKQVESLIQFSEDVEKSMPYEVSIFRKLSSRLGTLESYIKAFEYFENSPQLKKDITYLRTTITKSKNFLKQQYELIEN